MKKLSIYLSLFCLIGLFSKVNAADTVNVYVVNNITNIPQSNIMCTEKGGICTNGHFIMSSSRANYLGRKDKSKDKKQVSVEMK